MNARKQGTFVVVGVLGVGLMIAAALEAGDRNPTKPRDVILTGQVVDLQNFMTGTFPSSDHVKCTAECLRAGVPAALVTEDGLVIIGEGAKGPARTITEFAMAEVEMQGKLYERHGIRYIDMTAVTERSEEEGDSPWSDMDDPDEDEE
jgi:hypothetical protein